MTQGIKRELENLSSFVEKQKIKYKLNHLNQLVMKLFIIFGCPIYANSLNEAISLYDHLAR